MPTEKKQYTKRHQPEHRHLSEQLTVRLDSGFHHRELKIRKTTRDTLIIDSGREKHLVLTLGDDGLILVMGTDTNHLETIMRLE